MTSELASVLTLLIVCVILFARDRPRMDVVALIVICVLPFLGVIEIREALAGFSDPNIVLIAALFVLGEGLVRTGVARDLGDWLAHRAGANPLRLTALLMAAVCGLGSMMSSTAVTAIFIPVVLRICRRTGTSPGQLMMPLSIAGLISGMMTLVATAPNLIIHSELIRHGHTGFHFFSFTPFGVPILLLAIAYMRFARRWLPASDNGGRNGAPHRPTLADWVQRYRLAGREQRLQIKAGSPLAGKRLDEVNLREESGANLVAVERHGQLLQPTASTRLLTGDILFVDLFGTDLDVDAFLRDFLLQPLPLTGTHFTDRSQDIGMAEVIIPADSQLLGKSIIDAAFRTRLGVTVIGLRRGVQALEAGIREERLKIGDILLVIGPWKAIRDLQTTGERDLVPLILPAESEEVLPAPGKAPAALGVLLAVVVLMAGGFLPNVHAALLGCLAMGALGCIDLESAYRSIDWKTIVLIVGMLPFALALERTGGVELASQSIAELSSGLGPRGVLALLFATTAGLSLFISNTATAVLMAPIALKAADAMHASPYPFAMIVALAASTAFMTPVSSPVNTLVVTPGGYRFFDFVRIGVPLSLLVLLLSILLVPWLLPL